MTKRIPPSGWGQVAHGLRTVIGCCKDRRRRRRRRTDLSRDLSNEQHATRTMPLSRNQSKSAENLRCQRNLFMYFQLTRSVLRYLTVKITNKLVGINTPRMFRAYAVAESLQCGSTGCGRPGSGLRDHVTPSLCVLHWLPIAARIDYKLCLLVHKSFVGQVPDYITELLTPAASDPSRSSLRSSRSSNLIVRRARRKIGDRAFAVAAPRVWNRLPTELKIMRFTPAFKRHLKTYLFSSVYGAS